MRKILLTALFTAAAWPAFAMDSGDAAFELLSQYAVETQKKNYIKLQSTINPADAMEIDAKFSEVYGDPEINRSGLKVWEIDNTSGQGAKQTTLMCGPDGKGGLFISADRRGKAINKMAKGQEKQSGEKPKALEITNMKTGPVSYERD